MKRIILFGYIISACICSNIALFASEQQTISNNHQVCNLQGLQVKKVNISEKGKSEVQINTSDMKAGIYMYSLIVDNKLISSKQMIVSD